MHAAKLDRVQTNSVEASVAEAVSRNPKAMTPQIARELGVPEAEVIRYLPGKRSTELDAGRWEDLIRGLEPLGKVHVIVNTGAVVLEAFGQFGNFSLTGPFFNVQTSSLDMHIRHTELGPIFAVEKPSHMDGVNTLSFQFFTKSGQAAFKVFLTFGGDAPPPEKIAQFETLRGAFRKMGA